MSLLNIEKENNVAVVVLDDPEEKVNKLSEDLMEEVREFLEELRGDNSLRGAILISGKENNFIAGADLDMVRNCEDEEELKELAREGQEILSEIENFPKPIVACIHGSCMGGGTELALACRYRIISDHRDTKIALPEVKLGLLPGMGGTQRLPRLIGIQRALPYLLTGKNMYSRQARKLGFADEVVERNKLREAGIQAVRRYANKKVDRKDRRGIFEKLLENNSAGRLILFSQAHKQTARQTRGNYPAPPRIIESVRYGYRNGLRAGYINEAREFSRLAFTPESKALINLFFAMNEAKKMPDEVPTAESEPTRPAGGTGHAQKKSPAREVKSIGVLGAGLMGAGIAEVSAEKEYHVWLKDLELEQAHQGKEGVYETLQEKVKKKILTPFERDTLLSRIHPADSYEAFSQIDLVVEAVFEDLDLKRNIVAELEENVSKECIIASNTSSLPITQIAAEARHPERILGMHYFSPVQKMPLLEIIKTDQTAEWAVTTARKVGVQQGKSVIVVNDGPGFYTTRILAPYINEALLLLEEGAKIEQLDTAMKNFGFPVGPLALLDEVGIDVGAHVADVLSEKFEERGGKTSKAAKRLVEEGYKGRKNLKGFYSYFEGRKISKEVNEEIYQYFGGPDRKNFEEEEIQFRMIMMMVNESLHCLQEEILESPRDGDLGAILGLGFPPFLGGPFRYVDREGPEEVKDLLDEMVQDYGPRFTPAGLLDHYASKGELFYKE